MTRVLTELRRKARRSTNTMMNLVIFRLATCCGLRASEIAQLTLDDVRIDTTQPTIRIRKSVGKGKKARTVPITWDQGTLADLTAWKQFRLSQGCGTTYVCSQHCDTLGHPLERRGLRMRFKQCCKILGPDRQLSIHDGRHTFISSRIAWWPLDCRSSASRWSCVLGHHVCLCPPN